MSVFTIKSKVIANRDNVPPILSNPEVAQATVKGVLGVENTSNFGTDIGGAGTAIKLITIPSNARLQSLEHASDRLGTSSLDVTVFWPTTILQGSQNGPSPALAGTPIASSVFATAIAGIDAGRAWTDAMILTTGPTLQNRIKPLWSLLGLTADPGMDLDVGFTVRTAVVTNGYVGLRATYVD